MSGDGQTSVMNVCVGFYAAVVKQDMLKGSCELDGVWDRHGDLAGIPMQIYQLVTLLLRGPTKRTLSRHQQYTRVY